MAAFQVSDDFKSSGADILWAFLVSPSPQVSDMHSRALKTSLVLFHNLILDLGNGGFEQQAQSTVLLWRVGGGVDNFLTMGGGEGLPAPTWIEVDLLEFLLISLHLVQMVALIGNKNLSPDT